MLQEKNGQKDESSSCTNVQQEKKLIQSVSNDKDENKDELIKLGEFKVVHLNYKQQAHERGWNKVENATNYCYHK